MTEYLLRSLFCFLVLYLGYTGFFRNSMNYHVKRMTLLFSVAFSLLVPGLRISIADQQLPVVEASKPVFETLSSRTYLPVAKPANSIVNTNIAKPESVDISFLITSIYMLVALALLIRFACNIYDLLRKEHKAEKVEYQGNQLTLLDERIDPFTFFNSIFICRTTFGKSIDPELILHELGHKRQLHSIDIVFIELMQVIFWFNPFIYLFKKLIKANHEYLADDFVLRSGISCSDYSHKIINHTFKRQALGLASGFNHLFIKRRLIMLSKFNKKRRPAYQLLFFIPIMAVLFLITGFRHSPRSISMAAGISKMRYPDNSISTGKDKLLLKEMFKINTATVHSKLAATVQQSSDVIEKEPFELPKIAELEKGFFYADTLYLSGEDRKIWLRGTRAAYKKGHRHYYSGGTFKTAELEGKSIFPNR